MTQEYRITKEQLNQLVVLFHQSARQAIVYEVLTKPTMSVEEFTSSMSETALKPGTRVIRKTDRARGVVESVYGKTVYVKWDYLPSVASPISIEQVTVTPNWNIAQDQEINEAIMSAPKQDLLTSEERKFVEGNRSFAGAALAIIDRLAPKPVELPKPVLGWDALSIMRACQEIQYVFEGVAYKIKNGLLMVRLTDWEGAGRINSAHFNEVAWYPHT